MKLRTNNLIPEEAFSRKFAKSLIHTLRTNKDLSTNNFKIRLYSETKMHWMGGKDYATKIECLMAKKITEQLLRYYDPPYQARYTDIYIEFTS